LLSITARTALKGQKIVRFWTTGLADPPRFPDKALSVRLTLRQPSWSQIGYCQESPGRLFWFNALAQVPRFVCGQAIAEHLEQPNVENPNATNASFFHHRYYVPKETPRDRLTWHSAVLLEWDHGHHSSVIELAWLNGVGGYDGKSNWCLDKNHVPTALWTAMPGVG
jgi:hypothetical protein